MQLRRVSGFGIASSAGGVRLPSRFESVAPWAPMFDDSGKCTHLEGKCLADHNRVVSLAGPRFRGDRPRTLNVGLSTASSRYRAHANRPASGPELVRPFRDAGRRNYLPGVADLPGGVTAVVKRNEIHTILRRSGLLQVPPRLTSAAILPSISDEVSGTAIAWT
jgi:hypothetical protein